MGRDEVKDHLNIENNNLRNSETPRNELSGIPTQIIILFISVRHYL
jgi:hypothetical protein